MGKFEGKVALVTGSGRNIGRATVLKLAGEGAHVVVNVRTNQDEADAVVREARGLGESLPFKNSGTDELTLDAHLAKKSRAVIGV